MFQAHTRKGAIYTKYTLLNLSVVVEMVVVVVVAVVVTIVAVVFLFHYYHEVTKPKMQSEQINKRSKSCHVHPSTQPKLVNSLSFTW